MPGNPNSELSVKDIKANIAKGGPRPNRPNFGELASQNRDTDAAMGATQSKNPKLAEDASAAMGSSRRASHPEADQMMADLRTMKATMDAMMTEMKTMMAAIGQSRVEMSWQQQQPAFREEWSEEWENEESKGLVKGLHF